MKYYRRALLLAFVALLGACASQPVPAPVSDKSIITEGPDTAAVSTP